MGASSVTGTGLGSVKRRMATCPETRQLDNIQSLNDTNRHPQIVAAGSAQLDENGQVTIYLPHYARWGHQCDINNDCEILSEMPGLAVTAIEIFNETPSGVPISCSIDALAQEEILKTEIIFKGEAGITFVYTVTTFGVFVPNNPAIS